jgi:hypothetical protein
MESLGRFSARFARGAISWLIQAIADLGERLSKLSIFVAQWARWSFVPRAKAVVVAIVRRTGRFISGFLGGFARTLLILSAQVALVGILDRVCGRAVSMLAFIVGVPVVTALLRRFVKKRAARP